MALLDTSFDITDLPQSETSFDPLPAGWYYVRITKADLTPTKDGQGQYIKVRYDVAGGDRAGRVVFGNLNIKNASQKAEEVGRQQLGELMRAVGLSRVTDTDQLVGAELQIKVAIRPAEGKYDAQNEVKGFKSVEGGALPMASKPPAFPAAPSAPTQQAAPAKAAPPWAKK
jgi:hypothetical protein